MGIAKRVDSSTARRTCRPEDIPFDTTADAPSLESLMVGQPRAVDALQFGVGIRRQGYNLFAVGRPGVGKQTLLKAYLGQHAKRDATSTDWCYVHDFSHPECPRALELPSGAGVRLQRDMAEAIGELRGVMRSAFESEEYRARRQRISDRFSERQEAALAQVRDQAALHDVAVQHSSTGISIAPIHGGKALDPDSFRTLPEADQERLRTEMGQVGQELERLLHRFREWGREQQEAIERLDRELAASVAHLVLVGVRKRYAELPPVLEYLEQIERDVVHSATEFLADRSEGIEAAFRRALSHEHGDGPAMRRYEVNVLVQRDGQEGAPVVYEDNPSYTNLLGRIEHETQFGALITNFTLIKAGALHRAHGGYLLLDALKVLQQPFAWDALKRTIRSGEIRIEPLGEGLGLVPTVSLRPTPIPLGHTKVVLMGERVLYYLLSAADPDFLELFKVLVDFDDSMDRRSDTQPVYANLLATLVAERGLRAFDRGAIARMIEHAARVASDSEKLSLHMREIVDLLQEADYWAGKRNHCAVSAGDVDAAIDAQRKRAGSLRERMQEAIQRGDLQIATSGESVGQINGLSVFQLGQDQFGHPTRITARVRMGKGEVIDIEREVKLGGPLHSKGVLILVGFLGARYATKLPLSMSATLVFEQSYGSVEGDSASLAELCSLLSAIAELPVRQALAITGSVDQHGHVQAIGGVNEKVEGFFDICRERGLTGEQGVLIPTSNIKNLMVRRDVADAIESGQFHIYAIADVDEALELLTRRPAGEREATSDSYPETSINGLVEARLLGFAERARALQTKIGSGL